MERTYLNRYRLCLDRVGLPIVLRRSADEATLRADDVQSGDQVAVQLVPAPSLAAADREQLEAEARAAQQIHHINIPHLRDFGFDDDQLVYVTEYIEGITAEDWIKTKGPMPVGAVLRIASQMVSALVAASLHGVIHYAVYPPNILLGPGETADGEWPLIKVVNFLGVAPSLAPSNGSGPESLNPADFASPEQLKDGPVNFRSEIYSLGCALWFLLKGVPPAGGAGALEYAIGLPAPVRQLLAGMLAENPADRPADPLALQQQIQACVAQIERQDIDASKWGMPVALTPVAANETEPSPGRRSAWKSLALAAILVAIATLTVVLLAQRAHQTFSFQAAHGSETLAPSVTGPPQLSAAPATEAATGPVTLPSNPLVASADKSEEFSRNQPASGGINSFTQTTSKDRPFSTSGVETNAPPPTPENIERPAPVVAGSSSFAELGMAAREAGVEQLPSMPQAPPPAEGPAESEKAIVEIAPPETVSAAGAPEEEEKEERKDVPITSSQKAPEKNSKPARSSKALSKKVQVAAMSYPVRPLARDLPRQYPAPIVGHIFPPSWPETSLDEAVAISSSREERRHSRAPVHTPVKKKASVSPPLPPA